MTLFYSNSRYYEEKAREYIATDLPVLEYSPRSSRIHPVTRIWPVPILHIKCYEGSSNQQHGKLRTHAALPLMSATLRPHPIYAL